MTSALATETQEEHLPQSDKAGAVERMRWQMGLQAHERGFQVCSTEAFSRRCSASQSGKTRRTPTAKNAAPYRSCSRVLFQFIGSFLPPSWHKELLLAPYPPNIHSIL